MTATTHALSLCPQCGKTIPAAEKDDFLFCLHCRFPIKRIARKYQLLKVLGQGGVGTVYLARHVHLQRDAHRVIKIIPAEQYRVDIADRFQSEVQVTATLSQSNEHIVRIYDDFDYEPKLGYYYVMEYLQGQNLAELLKQRSWLPLADALHIFRQICEAMSVAHQEGIIHRDLKPENLFLVQRREDPYFVKIIDFGIARFLSQDDTANKKSLAGTPLYMSPEQCLNQEIDHRSDLYAMAVLFYEILSGRHPLISDENAGFSGSLAILFAHVWNPPIPLSQADPTGHLPPRLSHVMQIALAKDPKDRYPDAHSFWQAVAEAVWFQEADEKTSVGLRPASASSSPSSSTSAFDDDVADTVIFSSSPALDEDQEPPPPVSSSASPWHAFSTDTQEEEEDNPTAIHSTPSLETKAWREGIDPFAETDPILPDLQSHPSTPSGDVVAIQETSFSEGRLDPSPSYPELPSVDDEDEDHTSVDLKPPLRLSPVLPSALSPVLPSALSPVLPPALSPVLPPETSAKPLLPPPPRSPVPPPSSASAEDLLADNKTPSEASPLIASSFQALIQPLQARGWKPSSTLSIRRTNLPLYPTSFVGRETELKAIEEAFQKGHRLVSLLGPGGMGKSRLSVQYGHRTLSQYTGGVWFLDLSETTTLEGMLEQIADTLQIPLTGKTDAEDIQQIGHALKGRGPLLLLLDNLEQLVTFAPETLGVWLAMAPMAFWIVSTREILRLPEERILELLPLSEEEAMRLFLERIHIKLAPSALLAKVVHRLDRIPLAIELTAPRVHSMPLADLLAKLNDRFSLLASTTSALPKRQATMRGAIDWSWELLTPHEQDAFLQAALFRGGFSTEAAQAILLLPKDAPSVEEILASLKDKSLLRTITPPSFPKELRFGMYESIRAYALEKLAAAPERPQIVKRYALWYIHHSEELTKGLHRSGGLLCLQRLRLESENLLTVVQTCLEAEPSFALRALLMLQPVLGSRPAKVEALRLLDLLHRPHDPKASTFPLDLQIEALRMRGDLCKTLGHLTEAKTHLTDALELARKSEIPPLLLTGLLNRLGNLLRMQGQLDVALAYHEEALALAHVIPNAEAEAVTLGNLGGLVRLKGDLDTSERYHLAALRLQQEIGDRKGEGISFGQLGHIYRQQGRLNEAIGYYSIALATHRDLEDRYGEAIALNNLGQIHLRQGRLHDAEIYIREALRLHREIGDRRGEAIAMGQLGNLCRSLGRLDDAEALHRQAHQIQIELSDKRGEAITLNNLGQTFLAAGRLDDAAEAFEISIQIQKTYQDRRGQAFPLLSLAEIAIEQGRLDTAHELLQTALSFFSKKHTDDFHALVLGRIAYLLHLQGQADEAKLLYQEALAVSEQADSRLSALLRARLGSLQADLDARVAAETSLQIAQKRIERMDDPFSPFLLSLALGHLDLAYMREALQHNEIQAAQSHHQRAVLRLDAVPPQTSLEVRLSLRLLQARL